MAGPAIEDLAASPSDNGITASWRDALDSGHYRVQTRQVGDEWPQPAWRGSHAIEFNGNSGEHIETGPGATLEPGESLTIWIAPDRLGTESNAVGPGIAANGSSGNWDGWVSFRNTGSFASPEGGTTDVQLTFEDDSGTQNRSNEFTYTAGEPLALAFVMRDDGIMDFYADGEHVGESNTAYGTFTANYLGVGYAGATNDGTLDGTLDEVRHHNEVLSEEQVDKHYNNRPIYTSGKFYYTFDGGSGDTVVDHSGNGLDGTLSQVEWLPHQYENYAIVDEATTRHTLPNKDAGKLYEVRVRTETNNGVGPWTRPVYNYENTDDITRLLAGGLPGYYPSTEKSSNYDLLEPIGKHLGKNATDILFVDDGSSVQQARTVAELQELGKMIETYPREGESLEHYRARLIAEYSLSSGTGTIRSLIETAAGILDAPTSSISFNEPAGGEYGTAQVGLPGNAVDQLGLSEADLVEILDRLVAAGYRLTAQIIGTFVYINPADYHENNHDAEKGYDGLDENGDPKDNGGTYAGLIT